MEPTQTPTTKPRCCTLATEILSNDDAQELAAGFKALSDPIRVRLLSIIANSTTEEICACDLPELLGRSQATISHHLTILVKANIVNREQRGKWAWFSIKTDRLANLGAVLALDDETRR